MTTHGPTLASSAEPIFVADPAILSDYPRHSPRGVIWSGIVGWLGAVLLLDLSSIYGRLNGDSFIPVMVSLGRWEPFFWSQDYYGMLIPLLLRPIHSPLVNLMANEAFSFAGSLAAIFLVCRYFTPSRFVTVIACIAIAAFLGLWPSCAWDYIASQQFPQTALGFGLAALLVLESNGKRRRIGRLSLSTILMLCGCWINWSLPSLLFLMIGMRTLLSQEAPMLDRIKRAVPEVVLAAAGLGFGVALMKLYGVPRYEQGFLSPSIWIDSWDSLFAASLPGWAADRLRTVLLAGMIVALPIYFAMPAMRRALVQSWRPAAGMALVGVCYALLVGTQHWTAHERYAARFWYPMNLLMIISIACICLLPVLRLLTLRQLIFASWLSAGLACSAIVLQYGPPSM